MLGPNQGHKGIDLLRVLAQDNLCSFGKQGERE